MSLLYPSDKPLFSDFPNTQKADWIKQASLDLASKDFDKLLLGKLVDGLIMYPFYAKDDHKHKFINYRSYPDKAYTHQYWEFQQSMLLTDLLHETAANSLALKALQQGAEALYFDCTALSHWPDFHALLQDIIPEGATLSWKIPQHFSNAWNAFEQLRGVVHINPLEAYIIQGTDYLEGMDLLSDLLKQAYPKLNKLAVSGVCFVNGGATVVQEVALTCNLLVSYLDILTDMGHDPKNLFNNLEISLATRSAYFIDIAKYRAMQVLLHHLAATYEVKVSHQFPIRAVSSTYNKSSYDLHTNMLRNTTEAMAAVIGGCKTIAIMPHSFTEENSHQQVFARRMARNVSHLLRHEAHMDLVQDVAAGAYALEALTTQITEQAWVYFLDIEKKGGILEAYRKGIIQQAIGNNASDMITKVSTMQKTYVGSNRYIDESSELSEGTNIPSHSNKTDQSLHNINLPAVIERIRFSVDQSVANGQKRPCVGLISIQDNVSSSVLNTRFSFVQDVMASIGIRTQIFKPSLLSLHHPDEDLKQLDALVLVSDNAFYDSLQPDDLAGHISKYPYPFLLAGRPAHIHQRLSEYSLSACVYQGMHVLDFAAQFFSDIKFRLNEA